MTFSWLEAFGFMAVAAMIACDGFERRNIHFTLLFGIACAAGSVYGFMQGATPFGVAEAFWSCMKFWQYRNYLKERMDLVDQIDNDE